MFRPYPLLLTADILTAPPIMAFTEYEESLVQQAYPARKHRPNAYYRPDGDGWAMLLSSPDSDELVGAQEIVLNYRKQVYQKLILITSYKFAILLTYEKEN